MAQKFESNGRMYDVEIFQHEIQILSDFMKNEMNNMEKG